MFTTEEQIDFLNVIVSNFIINMLKKLKIKYMKEVLQRKKIQFWLTQDHIFWYSESNTTQLLLDQSKFDHITDHSLINKAVSEVPQPGTNGTNLEVYQESLKNNLNLNMRLQTLE